MNDETQRRLAAIAARWNGVEERMKEVELLRGEAMYSAINELRYTGRKIADVLLLVASRDETTASTIKINEQLVVAENYLNNADHDLTDAAILFVGVRVKRILELHGRKTVIRLIPDFDDYQEILDEAESVVVKSRGDRANRGDIYTRLAKDHVPKLVELYAKITPHAELQLPDNLERGVRLTTIFAILGSIAAVLSFIVNFIGWYFSPPRVELHQIRQIIEEVITRPR